MMGRRSRCLMAAFGSAAVVVGVWSAGAMAPALAVGPPKPPALCSLVSKAAMSSAIGGSVPFVAGRTVTGRSAVHALAKQADLALTPIFRTTSRVTLCSTAVGRRGGPPGTAGPSGTAGSPSGPAFPTLNLQFFNNVTRSAFLAQERNFRVESGSVPGSTGVEHNVITDVAGLGDSAFSLNGPSPVAGGLPSYDVFVLAGSTQVQLSVSAPTPDPTKVQALAGMIVTALHAR